MNHILMHQKNKHIILNPKINTVRIEQKQKHINPNLSTEQINKIIIEQKTSSKLSMNEFNKKINEIQNQYTPEILETMWKKRTNYTYKKILKEIIENKSITSAEDLIVYKVSLSDKDYKKLENDFKLLLELRKKYTIELEEQFNEHKREENLKKFKYSNLYINNKYNPNDISKLKTDFTNTTAPPTDKILLTKNDNVNLVNKNKIILKK